MSSVCTCNNANCQGCTLHFPAEYLNNPFFTLTVPTETPTTPFSSAPSAMRLPKIQYCDLGRSDGESVLVMLPSSCSRWVTAFFEPQARACGMRVIAMDRPGVGGVESVELKDRVEICTDMTYSLLEHLQLRPKNILVASAGIYYLLAYLLRLPQSWPLPKVYMLAPWAPPLNGTEAYFQPLTWIPSSLILNQHKLLPPLLPIITKLDNAVTFSGIGWTSLRSSLPFSGFKEANTRKKAKEADERWKGMFWGEGGSQALTERIMTSSQGGFGQDHLLTLARGVPTGPDWFHNGIHSLAELIRARRGLPDHGGDTLHIDVWWGAQDGMVPKQGRDWLDRLLQSEPDVVETEIHIVEDGNHNDLVLRKAGMGEVIYQITGKRL